MFETDGGSRFIFGHRARLFLCLVLAFVYTGCGGYMTRSEHIRRAISTGAPNDALARANEALGVQRASQLPSESDDDTPLLLLERATILQALGQYELSARDFQLADKSLDVFDLSSKTASTISKYLYSESGTVYKAPPYEKLLLNTVNMINYLVQGDAGGAKVEARRFLINRKFLQSDGGSDQKSMLALGSYLSGLAFEMAGDSDEAIRHYADAQDAGGVPTLASTIRLLNQRIGAMDRRVSKLLEEKEPETEGGDVIVIIQAGMTPYRMPKRIPIGAALLYTSNHNRGARLSRSEQNRANRFAAKGVLKWVNYPEMHRSRTRPGRVAVEVGGQLAPGGVALDVELSAMQYFDSVKGSILAAAIVRLITRAIAGSIGEAVGKKATKSGAAGFLIGLIIEGTMTATDRPDTRSWVTLPGRFYIARIRMPEGEHRLKVRHRNRNVTRTVNVKNGHIKVLNFSAIR
jgi:hypothetical protein